MADANALEGMRAVRLANDQVEVRRARSKIFAGVFGGTPKATKVGRFEVRHRLGAGGMGIVYEAYDPQLERRVALKVLRADATFAPDGAARLVEEARAMAKLSHPNVLTVYEAGTVDEQVFIAMALVEGYTLRSWLEAQSRSAEAVMEAMRAAGRGLVAAHEAGLVHRDFKPENVLVSSAGEVFVTDFGLARSYTHDSGAWRRVSSGVLTTKMAGTPAYMAPEQLRAQSIDARCDQFAWCVTAYEALVGERPFDEALLQRIAMDPTFAPDPPSIPASLPRRVRVALERGLSIDPEERYGALADLLDAVRPRRRAWVPITVGLGVAVVGLGAAAMMQRDPCPPAPEQLAGVWDTPTRGAVARAFAATKMPYAERARADVERRADRFVDQWVSLHQRACREDDARLAACLTRRSEAFGAVTQLLAGADAGVVEHAVAMVTAVPAVSECADPDAAFAALDGAEPRLDEARAQLRAARPGDARSTVDALLPSLPEGSPTWLDAVTLQGEIALERGDAEASIASFERAIDGASGESGRLPTARAAVGLLEVQATLATTDFDAAQILARSAKIAVASAGNPPRLRTRLESAHAGLEISQGNFDTGIAKVERAQALLAELGDDTLLERARLMLLAAQALFRKQQLEESKRLGDAAIEIFRDILGPAHPQVGRALLLPGSIALVRGEIDAAERTYREAADVLGDSVGRTHADYATAVVSLANVARARGDYAEARTLTAEALGVMEEEFPADNMRVLAVRTNLASLEHALGHLDAARSAYLETLAVQRKALGEHHDVSITLANLARVEQERGELEEAQVAADEALAIRRAVFGDTHDRTLATRLLVAEFRLLRRMSPKDVLAEVAEVCQLREAALGPDHPSTLEARLIQAKAALRSGEADAALRLAEDTLTRRETSQRPPGEVTAARVLAVQAAAAAGKTDRARQLAATISFDGPPASELRGWCDPCEDEMRVLLDSSQDD